MENIDSKALKDQVFAAEIGNVEDFKISQEKDKKELEYNVVPYEDCFKCITDFSSGDDCSTTYELKMENTIVKQNDTIMALHEDLEIKNKNIAALQDELMRKDTLIQEMEETILSQNESIEHLQDELNIKSKSVDDIQELLKEKDEYIQEIEKKILNLNSTAAFLEDELKNKNKFILDVNEEIKSKEALIEEMNNSLSSKNNAICKLRSDLEIKNENIQEIEGVIFRTKAIVEEAEGLKHQVSDLTNQVKGLEDILRVKNEAIQRCNQWHIEMKKEFEAQAAAANEKEENLKLEHEKEIEKLKQEFLEQFKLIGEKKSLLELFLENQVEILLTRLDELSGNSFGQKKEVETFRKIYGEELKKIKLNVNQFSEKAHTEHFRKQLEEFSKTLNACFFHERALKDEFDLKMEELREVQEELKQCKKMCDDVMSNEKELFTKLTQTEIELNIIRDDKAQFQQRFTEANNNYEKITIEFNRERMEMEKKYRQALDSYETDLMILNKSLQELLCNIPSSFETDVRFLGSGDCSLVSLNSDVNSMISNQNIYNGQKIVTKCLYELGKLCNEVKKISQENKAMRLAVEVRSKACEEQGEKLKKVTDELELMKSKYVTIEEERKYFENKLKYTIEENNNLNINIRLLNSKLSELNEDIQKYQEEIELLKTTKEEAKINLESCKGPNSSTLSPVVRERYRGGGGSDSELMTGGLHTPDDSFQSLPGGVVNVYTSTPFCRLPCDLEGGGELTQPQITRSHSEFQVSLLKWMEKCHHLDKENKALAMKVQDLELLNQELKSTMKCVKEEMDIFKEKQRNLEIKLNNVICLKKQLVVLRDENDLKEQQIKNLMKELDNVTGERAELFHKNLELEEMYKKHVSKLTEIKHIQNIGAFTDSITNTFNEKVKEIIRLKKEINSLNDEKKSLSLKVDLLIESNDKFATKLNTIVDKLCLSEEELEKLTNEKLEVFSHNKLLKKEVELLQIRVDYLSSLRDTHWCNPSSIQLFEDMQKEVLAMFRNSFETKFESQNCPGIKDLKEGDKINPLNLPEVLTMLSQQLKDEKIDFEHKATEFQRIMHSMKEENELSDEWFVRIDKMLRNIFEEMKYHKEQYYRIEEALRSTGKFHDELQKQKDELRIKEHELASIQKKWEEDKMKLKKSEGHLKMLDQDIVEKNELIIALTEQRDKMEKDVLELQKEVSNNVLKYETNIKSLEWKTKLEELRKSKQEIDEKIVAMQNIENEKDNRESLAKNLEEAEQLYLKAVEEVKAFLQAETSKNIARIQEDHKEQVEELQRVISEQAIRIGLLLKKSSLNLKESEDSDPDPLFINGDLRKQFDLAVYALHQLHQEELQLVRLQLEAEKYNEIYEAIHEKSQKTVKVIDSNLYQSKEFFKKLLVKKVESVLHDDFTNKLKAFFFSWHAIYNEEILQIDKKLLSSIDNWLKMVNEGNVPEKDNTAEKTNDFISEYSVAVESGKSFIHDLREEYNSLKDSLNSIIELYTETTWDCLEKIKLAHVQVNDDLKLKEELESLKKEKEELEKMHKNAIELLHADHKTEEDKIQAILTEIKKCCESGCDPNALLKIKDDLEEKHRKELEDLRAYYVQMCANMEKQYSEDVNSLHSRMLSLSSSCSDDIISDQMLFDRGGSGDHAGNVIISELLSESVIPLENIPPEQMKLIEELNFKWSEDVKEMKRELEQKYTKKIEQLQERLSTFIYNNELDISVRCIKDEVMRDCKNEMENIEKEISSRMLPYHDDIESLKSDNEFPSLGKDVWRYNECPSLGKDVWRYSACETDLYWEQLVVDLLGNFASKDAVNKVTRELAVSALRNVYEIQQDNFSKLSQFFKLVDNNLSNIEFKMKDKENQLLSLQNKLNSFSQIVLKLASSFRLSVQETKARNDLFNNTLQLEQMLEDGFNKELWPPELTKIFKIFKNKFEKMLKAEKEKCRNEVENVKQMLYKEKEILERSFESDLSQRPSVDEFHRLITERDSLKQMTLTLKSAVSQLVSYLNTCEDELNKTVVDELLKICDETPKKGLEFMEQDNSPGFRRVHFAPEVGISDLDESEDLSSILRLQLDSCLSKLKLEAASLLGLTALQPPPANLNKQIENLRKENEELLQEIADLKLRLEKNQSDSLELREQLFTDFNKENGSTFLQDKAQYMLSNAQGVPSEAVKLLEDVAKFGDKLINELQKERIDLQQQVDAADKQLKSTRQFLEEQAVERESERDEYAKEVSSLQNQLRECGKNWTSHERFTTEVSETVLQKNGKISLSVEELELQLKEANHHLEETEKKKELVEGELKDAIDKVWVLRDIISDLEAQLNTKSEKEALLERKLDELEAELDQQNGTQYAMAQELESLRSQSMDDGYLEQIKQLQENIKVQFNSSVVRQMKSQLRDMEKGIEHRTKELETLFLTNSSNSLSSPSEEVSLREQLEWNRCRTPEQCPSPVALPVEEISRLQERLLRHSRAEEVLIKRLRDQQITSAKLSAEIEEMHAEREVMQLQLKKQMAQLAESNNKIDDLRHKVETAQTAANKDLISQVQDFKEKYSLAEHALNSMQNQLAECKEQLLHAEEIINKQNLEIRNLAHCDHDIVDSLRLELAAVTAERNKLEELLDKYKRDFNLDVMNALLVDKNEDIDHLQHTVALLQNQEDEEKHGSCNSKGYRVSFATEIEDSSALSEGMRLRDAPQSNSLEIMADNIQVFGGPISPISCEKEENLQYSPQENFSFSPSIIPASMDQSEENTKLLLNNLQLELKEKMDQILLLEQEVQCLKTIEVDLKSTKSELESVLSSVSEDKQFYEKQLQSLQERNANKDEEIQRLKNILFTKDEEIIKTTADVQALREISLSLQEKLKEATALAQSEGNSILKEELSRLTLEIKTKEEKLQNLEEEILAYRNDIADEKELSQTLRSSLNIVTKEKLLLEERLESIKTDNSNLINVLKTAEDNLEAYVTAVRNLKNDLFGKPTAYGSVESHVNDTLANDNFVESEILKLKEEIVNLLRSNEGFRIERQTFIEERERFLEEIEELRSTITSNDFARKDLTINQLQDELKDLRKAVLAIKEEKLEVFASFSSEINKLQQSINELQESKQEAVEKWRNELSEKQRLQKKFESIALELEVEKQQNENQRQQLASKLGKLSFCDVNILDIPPMSYIPGLDALAEKMRKEIKLSATLDDSLLESILPDNNGPGEIENIPQERMAGLSDHESCYCKIRSLEKALLEEMEKARECKRVQREKESECQALETEKYDLKLHIDRLGRLLSNQNDKIEQILSQVESQKEKIITLELSLVKEQTSSKQMSSCLEEERSKAREAQREDITLIETMRQRLQTLMDNEIKLKKMVIDERQKYEQLQAQLNSVRALERYRSDSDDETQKHVKKMILHEREKYLSLKVEYEKEKRTCEDLREVLGRERTALCLQRDHLTKSERARSQIEKEMSHLKKQLNEELLRRQIAESKILEAQDHADSKFQKQLQSLENRNKKSLDAAYSIIRELEQEYNDLKQHLRNQQERDDNWKENVHTPLIQQLNEVNDNLDALVKERVDLKRTIERLNEENTRLLNLISDLRMVSSGRESGASHGGTSLQSPTTPQIKSIETVMPFLEREVEKLLHCALHEEHHRKALAYQKRYLLVALRGYQDAHSETVLRLQGIYHLRPRPFSRKSFRSVVLAVIAVFKLTKLPLKRLIRYNHKKENLLCSLKTSLTRSTAEAERLAAVPLGRQPAPHSPPSRDRAIQRYR